MLIMQVEQRSAATHKKVSVYLVLHCPKTTGRKFNLGVLKLYETHFIALFSVKYPYPVLNIMLHHI